MLHGLRHLCFYRDSRVSSLTVGQFSPGSLQSCSSAPSVRAPGLRCSRASLCPCPSSSLLRLVPNWCTVGAQLVSGFACFLGHAALQQASSMPCVHGSACFYVALQFAPSAIQDKLGSFSCTPSFCASGHRQPLGSFGSVPSVCASRHQRPLDSLGSSPTVYASRHRWPLGSFDSAPSATHIGLACARQGLYVNFRG